MSNSAAWAGVATTGHGPGRISLDTVLSALIDAKWRTDDIFQVPVVLITLLRFDSSGELLAKVPQLKMQEALTTLIESRPKRTLGRTQQSSAYAQFWLVRAMLELVNPARSDPTGGVTFSVPAKDSGGINHRLPRESIPADFAKGLSLALSRSAEISYDEMCRQLAFRAAGDVASFDVVRLAYSTITYYAVSVQLSGTAGLVDDAVSSLFACLLLPPSFYCFTWPILCPTSHRPGQQGTAL